MRSTNTSDVVSQAIKDLVYRTKEGLAEQWKIESRPFTLNTEYLAAKTHKIQNAITAYRARESPNATNNYTTEVQLIAHILGYLKIAYFRFIDIIPMRVEQTFQNNLAPRIRDSLGTRLFSGQGFEERCRAYLEDDQETAAKRNELNRKLGVLKLAENEVKKFQVMEWVK